MGRAALASRPASMVACVILISTATGTVPAGSRHMQQPVYWPDKLPSDARTYQKAFDSLQLQSSQGNHPQQNIDDIFGKGT